MSQWLTTQFRKGIDRVLAGFGRRQHDDDALQSWSPPVDIREEQNRFVVHAVLPGVDVKDIEVTLQNGALIIAGRRRSDNQADKDGQLHAECSSGRLFRRLLLPSIAGIDNVVATAGNGVLEVSIPKRTALRP